MASGNFVAYYRVSTAQQGRSGLGLEAQQQAVRAYLDGSFWKLIGEHTEVESGKLRDRPQLKAALEQCRLTGATLVIAKLDRLSRNVAFLAQLMDSKDVQFVAVDNPHATRFTLHILAAVDALDPGSAASGSGAGGRPRRGGEPRTPPGAFQAAATAAAKASAGERAAGVLPIARELRGRGMSLRQIAAELTERHVATPRGGAWSVTSVRNLIQRDTPTAIPGIARQQSEPAG